MIRMRRRNTAWLTALGLLIGFALLASGGALSAPVQLALFALFFGAMAASVFEVKGRNALINSLRKAPLRQKITPAAKEAGERAKSRGGYQNPNLMMLDIGLIAVQSSYDGMAMRRTRSVSKDDDGVRPFIQMYVEPLEADRNAVVRFEIVDQNGQPKYVHEVRTYLRDGEMNIMADHHLPLSGNDEVIGAGDWELRVQIDGRVVAMHSFNLAPSITERTRRLARQQGALLRETEEDDVLFEIVDEPPQQKAPSLGDLASQSRPSNTREEALRRRSSASKRTRSDSNE